MHTYVYTVRCIIGERHEPHTYRTAAKNLLHIYIYIYILLLLLLLLIIEHTTEGAEYYLVWGGDVEWGMNGRGVDSSGSCNCSQHLLYVRLSASDIKPTHR